MKQKLFGILLLGVFILGITGCEVKYPDLKDNAINIVVERIVKIHGNS